MLGASFPAVWGDDVAVYVIIVAIALSDWVQYARTVRGAVMVEKQKDYVAAARMLGRSSPGILFFHVLPNVLAPVLVIGTISLALAIVAESTLSYLGVGLPPTRPSLARSSASDRASCSPANGGSCSFRR